MSKPNILPSDRVRLLAVIDPDAYAASTQVTSWISAKEFANFLAVVKAGDIVATGTIDAKLQQATDGAGTGAKDVTGKLITQLTQAGGDSNKQALINLRPDELDVAGGFTHFRLSVTMGTAGSDLDAEVWGLDARYEPEVDSTTVDEIVS